MSPRPETAMRIAYFTNQYPAPSHTFIRREIVALETLGHEVKRYAIRASGVPLKDPNDMHEATITEVLVESGLLAAMKGMAHTVLRHPLACAHAVISALRYARAANVSLGRHLCYLAESLLLVDWCQRDDVDHIHAHFGTNSATIAALAHEISGIPYSFTVHGPEEFDRPEQLSLSRKIRKATFVVAVSSFGRSQLMRWADHRDWPKLKVVHCGIDETYLRTSEPGARKEDGFVCIARMSEQKGHLLLLQAASRLKQKGRKFSLVLIGDGPLRSLIEAEVVRLSLNEMVAFKGTLSQDKVQAEILRARAMVLPSFAEGLPMVLMESMALGVPVISTYIAGIPELVSAETGWLVPSGDVNALTDVMEQALSTDSIKLEMMGQLARSRAFERHDIICSARMLEKLMLESKRQTSAFKRRSGLPRARAVPDKIP